MIAIPGPSAGERVACRRLPAAARLSDNSKKRNLGARCVILNRKV
jgi:hypothetical protein